MGILKINVIVKLKIVVAKLQKSRFKSPKRHAFYGIERSESINDLTNIPKDVKEGFFGLIAVFEDDLRRFVVPISVLTQNWFIRLLEKAAEEYGFYRDGVLTLPCRPSELERVLHENKLSPGFVW